MPCVDCQGMDRDPKPMRAFTSILETFEGIAYLTIAFALSVPVVMLVISAVANMLAVLEGGVFETALAVLDGHDEREQDLSCRTVPTGRTHRCGESHPTAHRQPPSGPKKYGTKSGPAHRGGDPGFPRDHTDECALLRPPHAPV